MRIWRMRTWKHEVGTGQFECPACGSWQGYRLVRAQRWAYVGLVRLFAAGEPAEYVECGGCHGTFAGGATHAARAGREGLAPTDQKGMLHAMAAMAALRRQDAGGDGRDLIAWVFEALTDRVLSDEELQAALDWANAADGDLGTLLQELEPSLNDAGKERVVHAALFVAATDGRLERQAARKLRRVAQDLGMSRRRLKGIARLAA